MRDIIRLLFKSKGIFSTSLLHYCHLRLHNMTKPTSLLRMITQSTLPICSLTPSSLFFVHTTVTQNMCLLAPTLNISSKMPLSNTFAKSTKIRSMGPQNSLQNVVKLLGAYILCQIIATSKSSRDINPAFCDVALRAGERDGSIATFNVGTTDWRKDEHISLTSAVVLTLSVLAEERTEVIATATR